MTECLAFRGMRYARADRFGPAEILPLGEVRADGDRGPVSPQLPSRFDVILGTPAPLPQSEDCQVLSVFTPSREGTRPVMVWFHGGAFITGGGELPWYDGHRLSVEQDVVVVTVTARLGVLGHLVLEDDPDQPSPATTDHLAAIQWVHQNIDRFGGDPDNITLFGQSAGAFAIDVLLRWGVGPHVRGAILQSGFLSQPDIAYGHGEARRLADGYARVLQDDPRSASVPDLLSAQAEFARGEGRVEIWAPIRPSSCNEIRIPVVAGATRHDVLPFHVIGNGQLRPDPALLEDIPPAMQAEQAKHIDEGNRNLAREAVRNGCTSWLYLLAWDVPGSGWGAPHCIELPYLLGDRHAWSQAPMLRGAGWDEIERRGRYLRAAWAAFARDGCPGDDWTPFEPDEGITVLDATYPKDLDSRAGQNRTEETRNENHGRP